MSGSLTRRGFLGTGAALGAVAATQIATHAKESAGETIVIGVMGVNGRGLAHARGFAQQKNCEVAYVCDVDSRTLPKGVKSVEGYQSREPQAVGDLRKMLDDKSIDAISIAAPNHWHAPATILGCNAGKHVYVEKPCSHTPEEGELQVAAARKYDRVVTMGAQRRSRAPMKEAIARVHAGDLGKVRFARTWYNNRRGPIGVGKQTDVPSWLDFELWQGPTTDKPFKDNLVHYNWHWHWHWGNGELGNNGVHALDVARWGMQVDYPIRVTSAGGRYRFEDDQETADTHFVSFDFGGSLITWEGLSWSPLGPAGTRFGVSFHGDKASMILLDSGYTIYDLQNKEVEKKDGSGGDAEHFADFLDCIRSGGRPALDIEDGHKSTLLCHLGNIAQRTGKTINCDPKNGRILEDADAAKMWSKTYREGWKPTV